MSQRARSEAENKEVKWTTLEHAGVLFPPDYQPHGIKMKYEGQDVDLTPEQVFLFAFSKPCIMLVACSCSTAGCGKGEGRRTCHSQAAAASGRVS